MRYGAHMPNSKPAAIRTIRETRLATGMSMNDVRDAMRDFMPARLVPTVATLSRMETGATAKLDTIVVCAMAKVLGCPVSDLSPDAAAELETMRYLVEHTSPCITAQVRV